MPVEQIRTILIVALAFLSFMLWQTWQIDYGPKPTPPEPANTTPSDQTATPPPSSPGVPAQAAPTETSPTQPTTEQNDVPTVGSVANEARKPDPGLPDQAPTNAGASSLVSVKTDVYDVVLNPLGGTIEKIGLLHYPISKDRPDQPFPLFNDTLPDVFMAQTGFVDGGDAPNHHALYTIDSTEYRLQPGQDELKVVFRATGSGGLSFEKTYTFSRGSYAVPVDFKVINNSGNNWQGSVYGQFQRTQVAQEGGLFRTYTYTGGVISRPEKPYEKIDFEDMATANLEQNHEGGWIAMIQHYFAGAWVPEPRQVNLYYTRALPEARYVLGVRTPAISVPPEQTRTIKLTLYAGPKIQNLLEAVAPNLERTVDYGWLWFIAQPLFWLLQQIQSVLSNWGWSIIVLTLCIKLAFFHLSAASYKSMAKMRKVQPRIMQIRDRHQGDRQRMNQAMMELYKEEKINPLGGCLPIVVQIPVFIALYWVLLESVELRQAPFMFWLDDLSVHDPFFVLPILMGITMIVQQRLNPPPPDPMQARIMMALPFVFTFLFLFFPSGLVLYWFVNNLLSIAQQWVITRKIVGTA